MTAEARRQLSEYARRYLTGMVGADGAEQGTAQFGWTGCPGALEVFNSFGVYDGVRASVIDWCRGYGSGNRPDVTDISVDGTNASAHLDGSLKPIQLSRENDQWKVAAFDFSDSYRGTDSTTEVARRNGCTEVLP
jgi:hypothetical protein